MNEKLATQAEIEKLSRLLGVTKRELHFLTPLPSAKIAELRETIADVLFEDGHERFDRIDRISRGVPPKMAAAISQRFFGPLMTAMITATYPPQKAAANVEHMTPQFLAEVSLHLEPSRARPILEALPDDAIVSIARELLIRREFVTMGRFVGFVSPSAIQRTIDAMTPIELLSTGMFIESRKGLDEVISSLSDERLLRVMSTAATANLWIQALTIVDMIGPQNRARLANLAASLDDDAFELMAKEADQQGVFDVAVRFVALMSEQNRARIGALRYMRVPGVMARCYASAARSGRLLELMTVATAAPPELYDAIAAGLAAQTTEDIAAGAEAADMVGARPFFDTILEHMDPSDRKRARQAVAKLRSA